MDSMSQYDQQVAIVTGATSGIGSWLAAHLHKKGYLVALCGRREKEGLDVARIIDDSGESVLFQQCDVTSYASQSRLFQAVWKKWGRIDVLVANAGCVDRDSKYIFAHRKAHVDDLPSEPDTTCTDIDLKGIIYGSVLATHFMRHNTRPGGKIIVTGSMIGIYPCQTFPEYCAAKAAVHQWVKTTGPVLHVKENISVNCVMPGGIETPAMPGFSKAFRPEQMTLRSNLLAGYDLYLDDQENKKTGETVEAAHDELLQWGHPGYKSGAFSKRTEAVFEPWFEMVHGESSGLPGTIKNWPDMSDKVIVVTGATGTQGGGVVNVMSKTPGWRVRAVTRRPDSETAQGLVKRGIEVVQADYEDETSLVRAFEGAQAIFSVTQWWEALFQGATQEEAGVIEERHGMNIARAAAATQSLEHFLWSTTPSAQLKSLGKLVAPHMDYKAKIDARIKAELPQLAALTTYLYFGFYPQNMAFFPLCKPIVYEGTDQYIQTLPTKADAKVLLAGDMSINPGIWVRQILATGSKAFGRYTNVALEKWTFQQMVDIWSEVTGKRCVFTEITLEAATKLHGVVGNELSLQFKFGEFCDPWEEDGQFLMPEDLGIDRNEVVGFRKTIEGLKERGFWA